jgi:hypothetical protein
VVTQSPIPLGLTRDAAHTYTWNDGTRVWTALPSVTTILRVVDRSGPLVGWAKREAAACAVRNLDMLVRMRDTGGESAATDWLKRIPDHERDNSALSVSRPRGSHRAAHPRRRPQTRGRRLTPGGRRRSSPTSTWAR